MGCGQQSSAVLPNQNRQKEDAEGRQERRGEVGAGIRASFVCAFCTLRQERESPGFCGYRDASDEEVMPDVPTVEISEQKRMPKRLG